MYSAVLNSYYFAAKIKGLGQQIGETTQGGKNKMETSAEEAEIGISKKDWPCMLTVNTVLSFPLQIAWCSVEEGIISVSEG